MPFCRVGLPSSLPPFPVHAVGHPIALVRDQWARYESSSATWLSSFGSLVVPKLPESRHCLLLNKTIFICPLTCFGSLVVPILRRLRIGLFTYHNAAPLC